ncbi:protein GVQW3-like [Saccoglossus kowalevskii]|uniref:Uncharacterized protein LOC102807136 n=1 Tax=Saccoglossus kowalevskii TaxID=10224 RepID=A0ABM0M5R8_SACKO|nr:PREDICTED: uncharacterized protein LOC102807136 [Saccoglossus kowalevskii]
MIQTEIRAVIKYLYEKGMTPKEIHEDMVTTLGEDSPSYSTIKNWVANFKRGKERTKDGRRFERPQSATTDNQVEAIHRMVMNDRRVTILHIGHSLGIIYGAAQNVLLNILE